MAYCISLCCSSEKNDVLTCLGAGDFFGEIGILNIDGANRRTADVRSVGYSELFSLSKEDVLEGCRDYPEAERKLYEYARNRLGYERTKKEAADKTKSALNTLTSCSKPNPITSDGIINTTTTIIAYIEHMNRQ
jgi:CRP-like cAMP-binding protein